MNQETKLSSGSASPPAEGSPLPHDVAWLRMISTGEDETELEVCNDIASRQIKGVAKYGVTVAKNPLELKDWLQHAYEECLDQAVYLKRAMREMENEKAET